MRISKFVNNPDETPLHTSGFAKAASPGMGATSPESFSARKQRDASRIAVHGYNRSIIGQPVVARQYNRPAVRPNGMKPSSNARVTPPTPPAIQPQRFQEPPGRGYNPYG